MSQKYYSFNIDYDVTNLTYHITFIHEFTTAYDHKIVKVYDIPKFFFSWYRVYEITSDYSITMVVYVIKIDSNIVVGLRCHKHS